MRNCDRWGHWLLGYQLTVLKSLTKVHGRERKSDFTGARSQGLVRVRHTLYRLSYKICVLSTHQNFDIYIFKIQSEITFFDCAFACLFFFLLPFLSDFGLALSSSQ